MQLKTNNSFKKQKQLKNFKKAFQIISRGVCVCAKFQPPKLHNVPAIFKILLKTGKIIGP